MSGTLHVTCGCPTCTKKRQSPELTSFDRLARLEQKIDTFAINQVQVCKGVDGILEGQGRLLAKLDEFDGDFAKLYNGHGLALSKIGELMDAWNELMKLRPKPPRRAKKKR